MGNLYSVKQVNGGTDRGQWRIENDQVCLTWCGSSQNGCLGMMKDGEDHILFGGGNDAPRPFAKVVRE
ncbi:hypothetical protein UB46_12805 [Burkholderiaceae bacterium 16]|nr:hypothetical protein UB46_12805 [Burkholderiaceae bacterium 16]